MLQSHQKPKTKNDSLIKNLFIAVRTCPMRTFFHEAFSFLALGRWRGGSESHSEDLPSILKIREVRCVTLQLRVKYQTDDPKRCLVSVGHKRRSLLPFSFFFPSSSSFFCFRCSSRVDSYDGSGPCREWNLMSTMKSPSNLREREVAFLNVPIIHLHFSKLFHIHHQRGREVGVNADLLLSIAISNSPLEDCCD